MYAVELNCTQFQARFKHFSKRAPFNTQLSLSQIEIQIFDNYKIIFINTIILTEHEVLYDLLTRIFN